METKFLLPGKYKPLGWVLLIISVVLGTYLAVIAEDEISFLQCPVFAVAGSEILRATKYFSIIDVNITYTLNGILFIIGGLLVAFSKEKTEDEFISKLRLLSFQWAFLINYIILLLMFIFIYGLEFFSVMVYNMFTILILFILRFQYLLYKYKSPEDEK